MPRVPIRLALAVVTTVLVAHQDTPSLPRLDDYPSADRPLWTTERNALLRARAAEVRPDSQDAPDIITFLTEWDRSLEAVSLAREVVRAQPARVGEVAQKLDRNISTSRPLFDPSSGVREALRGLVAEMRAVANAMPREQAAHVARTLLSLELAAEPNRTNDTYPGLLRAFITQYAGTTEAALAEVDLIEAVSGNLSARMAGLEAYVSEHPGTVAAAKALYWRAQFAPSGPPEVPVNSDPTERFIKTVGIVDQLASGTYPPCEWVDRAPSLVLEFYAYQPRYSPENLDRVLGIYREFLTHHFVVDPVAPLGNTAGYVITSKMADLFKMKNDAGGVERTLDDLERSVADPDAVRFLRAVWDFSAARNEAPESERPMRLARSTRALLDLADRGHGDWPKRALALLASQQFANRDFKEAITTYQRYITRYPQSDWAPVAALHIGQAQVQSGDTASARATFRTAATAAPSRPVLRVVALTWASQVSAALREFDAELADSRRALEAWDPRLGPTLRFGSAPATETLSTQLQREDLAARIDQLTASLSEPGGVDLETGRWRLRRGDWDAALTILEGLPLAHPASPVLPMARALVHRARLERALALADVANPKRDVGAADNDLKGLAAESLDFGVAGAGFARAAMSWTNGRPDEARDLLRGGLEAWRTGQPIAPTPAVDSLAADVLAIRDVVFRPLGGGLYPPRWNGFDFPASLTPYLLALGRVQVVQPGGRTESVAVNRQPAGFSNVLFFDADQEALLNTLMTRLGGTATRRTVDVMETPNQPIGRSVDILKLFNEFFPARPGHWGGWVFFTYPLVHSIEFRDAARTRAAAAVEIGYAGATVILEKRKGTWVAVMLTNEWVT